jgi:hypothetical protein
MTNYKQKLKILFLWPGLRNTKLILGLCFTCTFTSVLILITIIVTALCAGTLATCENNLHKYSHHVLYEYYGNYFKVTIY